MCICFNKTQGKCKVSRLMNPVGVQTAQRLHLAFESDLAVNSQRRHGLLKNMNGQELCLGQKDQVHSGTDTISRFFSSQLFFLIHQQKGQDIHKAHRIIRAELGLFSVFTVLVKSELVLHMNYKHQLCDVGIPANELMLIYLLL